jgi:hypothetical protein
MRKKALLVLILLVIPLLSWGDLLILEGGEKIHGVVLLVSDEVIVMDAHDEYFYIPTEYVMAAFFRGSWYWDFGFWWIYPNLQLEDIWSVELEQYGEEYFRDHFERRSHTRYKKPCTNHYSRRHAYRYHSRSWIQLYFDFYLLDDPCNDCNRETTNQEPEDESNPCDCNQKDDDEANQPSKQEWEGDILDRKTADTETQTSINSPFRHQFGLSAGIYRIVPRRDENDWYHRLILKGGTIFWMFQDMVDVHLGFYTYHHNQFEKTGYVNPANPSDAIVRWNMVTMGMKLKPKQIQFYPFVTFGTGLQFLEHFIYDNLCCKTLGVIKDQLYTIQTAVGLGWQPSPHFTLELFWEWYRPYFDTSKIHPADVSFEYARLFKHVWMGLNAILIF